MSDDEFDALRPARLPADLQSWNIEDLESYCQRLQAEIDRAQEKIKEKKSVSDAAAALFKS